MYRIDFERANGTHFTTSVFKLFSQATAVWQRMADDEQYVHGKLEDVETGEIIWSF